VLRVHGLLSPPTRLLQRSSIPQCTHAYAVSARGARKLLYHTSLHLDNRLDMTIADLVRDNTIKAFTVIPPIMVQWRTSDRPGKDTDVGYDTWPVQNWGFAHSLRYKLRKDFRVGWDA
jgi:hypothetical protein